MRYFLIPARGGSKTILDKNLVDLGGHPLIRWTIETAKAIAAPIGAPVYVTSDDAKILDVAEACGAQPHKRPDHLADDQATMKDVLRQFWRSHPEADEIVLLFPTVPFRTAETLKNAMDVFDAGTMRGKHTSLMSVGEHRGRPFGGVTIQNGKMIFGDPAEAYYRKQDTPSLYYANGSIFIIAQTELEQLNTQLFNKDTHPYICYGIENLDIDTPFDLEVARAWASSGMARPKPSWSTLSSFADCQEVASKC